MANLNDLSEFVKRDDLIQGEVITFVDAGEIKDVDFSRAKNGSDIKKVFQIKIRLADSREKIITINKTSRDILGEAFGKDTDNWINKVAEITYVQQLCFGKMTDVLVLKPIAVKG